MREDTDANQRKKKIISRNRTTTKDSDWIDARQQDENYYEARAAKKDAKKRHTSNGLISQQHKR